MAKKIKGDDGVVNITPMIREIARNNKISEKEIKTFSEINHPLFSFKYLKDTSINECREHKFFYEFILRLQKLSDLGWDQIRLSHRHSYGIGLRGLSSVFFFACNSAKV